MSGPIFLILGTPASGKSTVAQALTRRFARGLHIPVDVLRHMVTSGLVDMGMGDLEENTRQLRLARQSAGAAARLYADEGFAVCIDDFWLPGTPELGYDGLPGPPDLHRVLLWPTLEVTLERLRTRNPAEGSFKDHLARGIREIHAAIAAHPRTGWQVIDSSDLSVDQTVKAVLRVTRTRPA